MTPPDLKQETPLPPTPSSPPGTGKGGGFDWTSPSSWLGLASDATVGQVEGVVTWGDDQVEKVWGIGGKIIHGISAAVVHFVNVGVHVLESLVLRIVGILHHMIAELFVGLHQAEKLISGPIDWIKHSATWLGGELDSFGQKFNADVVQPAIHDAVAGLKDAGAVVTTALHGIEHFDTWVVNDAIKPIEREVANVESGIGRVASALLNKFETDVVDPVIHDVDSLVKQVDGITKVLTSDALAALKVLNDTAWALLLLAEYTPDVIASLASSLEGGTTVKDLLPSPAKQASTEADLNKYFHQLLGG